ncbi:hypothetical protein [Microbacterium sp. NIBRBAC000506063]|uniref:hypothetical protein n=1 Tax=Microbacterium sp. NIBRBAC000506063 TaxID=2734618 RepID=UPI00397FEA47
MPPPPLREAEEGEGRGVRPSPAASSHPSSASAAAVIAEGSRPSRPSIAYQERPGIGQAGQWRGDRGHRKAFGQIGDESEEIAFVGAVSVQEHEQRLAGAL